MMDLREWFSVPHVRATLRVLHLHESGGGETIVDSRALLAKFISDITLVHMPRDKALAQGPCHEA